MNKLIDKHIVNSKRMLENLLSLNHKEVYRKPNKDKDKDIGKYRGKEKDKAHFANKK